MQRSNRQSQVVEIPLHESAQQTAYNYIDTYGISLILQAKMLAFQRGDALVLNTHIQAAREMLIRDRERKWWREASVVFFGALFGAGAQGFISELGLKPMRPEFIAVWAGLSVLSLAVVFIGLLVGKR